VVKAEFDKKGCHASTACSKIFGIASRGTPKFICYCVCRVHCGMILKQVLSKKTKAACTFCQLFKSGISIEQVISC